MPTLRWTSTMLTTIGCRKPPSWTSSSKLFLYKVYGIVVLFLVQSVTLTTILDIVFNVKTQNDFGDNLYLTGPMLIACCKLCSLLANRDSILILMHAMRKKPYLPADDDELRIETRYDAINERITSMYTISIEFCIAIVWVTSLMRDPKNKMLAFRAWHPYNYSSPILYAATYAHQAVSVTIASLMNTAYDCLFSGLLFSIYSQLEILGHRQALSLIIGSLINVGFDSLFSGLILSICSQLEILGHRLQNIQNDTQSARECARHHDFIYKFATKMNEDFQTVLLVQFLSSMTISCFCLYRITQTELGDRLPETMVYAVCFLFQLFFYCWYGNEVRLKSLEIPDMIFASNWESLNQNTKSTLLMIMLRATFPIEFTSAYVLAVNLKAFMMVIKTSYSAYNLLQGS